MLREERHRIILEQLHSDGLVTVAQLSQSLGVSEVTIRRDLRELDEQGKLQRARGGALSRVQIPPPEPPVVQRMEQAREIKDCIGRQAASLIADGDAVFIGSGSTAVYVARHLTNRRNLTVVTNALTVASELAAADGVTVVMTGGMMRGSELSLVGHIAELALDEVRVDKVVMGMRAISLEAGLTNDFLPEVMTDRAIIKMARELIIVADHTKFGKVAAAYVAPVSRITTLITDPGIPADTLAALEELGIRVIMASCTNSNGNNTNSNNREGIL